MRQNPSKNASVIGLFLAAVFITVPGSALSSVEGVTKLTTSDGNIDALLHAGDDQVESGKEKEKTSRKDHQQAQTNHTDDDTGKDKSKPKDN